MLSENLPKTAYKHQPRTKNKSNILNYTRSNSPETVSLCPAITKQNKYVLFYEIIFTCNILYEWIKNKGKNYSLSSYQTNPRIDATVEIKSPPCEIWTPDRRIFSVMRARIKKLITDLDSPTPISFRKFDIDNKLVKT